MPAKSDLTDEKASSAFTLSVYDAPTHAYDEALDETRLPRHPWQFLLQQLQTLGDVGVQDCKRQAQRILREDGAVYDLSHEVKTSRVWALDIVPNIIAASEWQQIEQGLQQRARLLDGILQDIYGEQNLIKQGLIPADILFTNPAFLRQCHNMPIVGQHALLLHAVDMVRDVSGQYHIIADRTQIPSGSGYALENRTVMSRVMPETYQQSQVRRLAPFFQTLKQTLAALTLPWTNTPRIVILSPGVFNSNYFEQTYLTNYLGFPLVQGGDLTVRNGKVWMKSLNGLVRVDVIIRHIDDVYCDQAELRPDSMLGVAGLLEAARAGNVVLANPLGCGILEAPALLKYLPRVSEFLLDEPLLLPSVPTWWCGEPDDLAYVIANIEKLIIKPTSRQQGPSIYGHTLTDAGKADAIEMLQAQPHLYVAQSYIPGSVIPVWHSDGLQAKPSLLRTFSAATLNGYQVLPGGLSRVGAATEEMIVSNLSKSNSKDTWVLAEKPESPITLLSEGKNLPLPVQENVPSRVVENLFWLGRYAERIEMNARFLRTLLKKLYDIDPLSNTSCTLLLDVIARQTTGQNPFNDQLQQSTYLCKQALINLIATDQQGSIKADLQAILGCSEQAKETLSSDTRIIINGLRDQLHQLDQFQADNQVFSPEEVLDNLVTSLLALSGLYHESMLRGLDWTFQELGRRTERALKTAALIQLAFTRVLAEENAQQQVLESVLLSAEALISFRRRYRNHSQIDYGLDLLMMDAINPRSLFYQLRQIQQCLLELPRSHASPESELITQCLALLEGVNLIELVAVETTSQQREKLNLLLTQLMDWLGQFTKLINDKYFDHTSAPHPLSQSNYTTN
ncbi:hypothetical protein CBF23_006435 [Marinomonas agarivorans]|nr:hypothetical protein CBF23_006435 [Marinomonas agarivorans]